MSTSFLCRAGVRGWILQIMALLLNNKTPNKHFNLGIDFRLFVYFAIKVQTYFLSTQTLWPFNSSLEMCKLSFFWVTCWNRPVAWFLCNMVYWLYHHCDFFLTNLRRYRGQSYLSFSVASSLAHFSPCKKSQVYTEGFNLFWGHRI